MGNAFDKLRLKALDHAEHEVGKLSTKAGVAGGEDVEQYLFAIGLSGNMMYCTAFVGWCVYKAADDMHVDSPLQHRIDKRYPARTPEFLLYYAKLRGWVVTDPQPGDIFVTGPGPHPHHGGFVEMAPDSGSTLFDSVEANTWITDDQGKPAWGVHRRQHKVTECTFIRISSPGQGDKTDVPAMESTETPIKRRDRAFSHRE